MTIREALQILKPFKDCMIDQHGCPISDAAIALDVVIKELENKEWTPCSERLPEEGEKVLLVDEDGDIDIGRMIRTNNGCLFDASTWLYDIDEWQAWMPLPKVWEGEKDD